MKLDVPKEGLFIIAEDGMKLVEHGKKKEVLYAIPMKLINAQILYWIICVKE